MLDDSDRNGKTLSHMRELIFKHDNQEDPASALKDFYEQFQEMAILGNSVNDFPALIFIVFAMGEVGRFEFNAKDAWFASFFARNRPKCIIESNHSSSASC